MTLYPDSIDSTLQLPHVSGVTDEVIAINATIDSVIAIETELGIDPHGIYSNVATRLSILEGRIGPGPTITGGPIDINNANLAGVLSIAKGGTALVAVGTINTVLTSAGATNLYKLLTNNNIDSAAAIDGYKITPNFLAQNITTTGTISIGATINITGSSAGVMQFANTITSISINQADVTTNSATGSILTIQAQNATGTTANGGSLNLTAGTGTTKYGNVNLTGPMVIGAFTQAMADAPKTINPANSINNIITVTGVNSTVRALTISCAPTNGTMKIIKNSCTSNGITVQFLTGSATSTIAVGKSAIVWGDGTNAQMLTFTSP